MKTGSGLAAVGLIGVGMMGHGIASSVLRGGYPLLYLRHAGNQPTGDLDARGAQARETAAELAAACDALVLCVSGTPQVEAVLLGDDGLLDAVRPGTVVIDCSTAVPASTVALAARVAEKGASFVDAAMTRTPKEAEEGRLNLLVGGEDAAVERVLPLLRTFAENIFRAGPVGTGHQLKLLHNFVSLGQATLLAEAFACAARGGVDMAALADCLAQGGGRGVALERMAPFALSGETAQMRFSIANAAKDMGYYRSMAAALGAADGIARGVGETLDALVARGEGEALVPEQIGLLNRG